MTIRIPFDSTILFIGDSITDAGRNRSNDEDLGNGYPSLIAERLASGENGPSPRVINRGISGNRVSNLRQRWTTDCIGIHPDIVSVLVGINDTGWFPPSDSASAIKTYETDYRAILRSTRDANTDVQFVLIEPFLLPLTDEQRKTRPEVDLRIDVVRQLATEFHATLLLADTLFSEAAATTSPEQWCHDGVHPTPAGQTLLADEWLKLAIPDQHDGPEPSHRTVQLSQ